MNENLSMYYITSNDAEFSYKEIQAPTIIYFQCRSIHRYLSTFDNQISIYFAQPRFDKMEKHDASK